MFSPWLIPIVFASLSLFFGILVMNDYIRSIGRVNPALKIWLRMAIIFALVSLGLSFLYIFL